MWYYHDGTNAVGPFSGHVLNELRERGIISEGTLVRPANADSWKPFSTLKSEIQYNDDRHVDAVGTPVEPRDARLEEVLASQLQDSLSDIEPKASDVASFDDDAEYNEEREHLKYWEKVLSPTYIATSGWSVEPVTPWRRYGARFLDNLFNGGLGIIVLSISFYAIAPASADQFFTYFQGPEGRLLDTILTTFVASIISGLMIGATGTSLGKAIFGIKVLRKNKDKIGLIAGVGRDIEVWVKGLGLGIPIIALFTLINAYTSLKRNGTTSWDSGRYIVMHRKSSAGQYLLNIIGLSLIVLLFIGYVGINQM